MTTYTIRIGIVGLLFSTIALDARAEETVAQKQLRMFRKNPKAFMQNQGSIQKFEQIYQVIKRDKDTGQPVEEQLVDQKVIPRGQDSKFSSEAIQDGSFRFQKNAYHEGFAKSTAEVQDAKKSGRAEFDVQTDNPSSLVEQGIQLKTLEQMENYKNAALKESPWSGDYWAIYSGVAAKRYNDPKFMDIANSGDWKAAADYITTANSSSMELLSPAEKYDMLVGDTNGDRTNLEGPGWGLTKAMLKQGKSYFERDGKVETWMGICHGWAPSAFMERRPLHSTVVMAADGKTKLTFYPTDVKALASLLWAQTKTKSNFVGSRCNVKDSELQIDSATGRIKNQECFDTNPGTWHLAVVNQLGFHKRSFVVDATFDYEVWNQPAYSYSYTFFNPQTGKEVDSLAAARVAASKIVKDRDGVEHATFDGDKFQDYRSKNAKQIVGVAMKFVYIAETRPSTATRDVQDYDRRVAVNYLYDLELNEKGEIIGGEWYHKQHPDFLWAPPVGTKALSRGDVALDGQSDQNHWKLRHKTAAPEAWRTAAIQYSSPKGQPLARIIKELVQKSNQVDFWFFGQRHWNKKGTGNEQRY